MTGGGEDWIDAPWDFITSFILMGLCLLGARNFAGDGGTEYNGSTWV